MLETFKRLGFVADWVEDWLKIIRCFSNTGATLPTPVPLNQIFLVTDASTQLIALLQERDALRQEAEVRRVAIEQLLKLQTGARRSPSVVGKTGLDTSQRNSLPV